MILTYLLLALLLQRLAILVVFRRPETGSNVYKPDVVFKN